MNNKKITRRMLRLLSMKISITTVVVAVSTTVALFGGHIVIVSAQLEDRTTLFTVAGLLIVLSWGAAWIIPKLLSESLDAAIIIMTITITSIMKNLEYLIIQSLNSPEGLLSVVFLAL